MGGSIGREMPLVGTYVEDIGVALASKILPRSDGGNITLTPINYFYTKEWQDFRLLQFFWDALRWFFTDRLLADPMFPVILGVGYYWVHTTPFGILDLLPEKYNPLSRYKIQTERVVEWRMARKAIAVIMWNNLMYILPVSLAQWIFQPETILPKLAPTVWEYVSHIVLMFIVFDVEYGVWHSIHHKIRFLYKTIHCIHHQYYSPFAWATQYLHPWELFCVGVYNTSVAWIFDSHCLSFWSFTIINVIVSVDAHCGYDLPWMPHHWIPFGLWGGSTKHDMHHYRPLTNFQPFFTWADKLFGTACPGRGANGEKPPALVEFERTNMEKKMQQWF